MSPFLFDRFEGLDSTGLGLDLDAVYLPTSPAEDGRQILSESGVFATDVPLVRRFDEVGEEIFDPGRVQVGGAGSASNEAAEAQFAQDPYNLTGGIVESVTFHEWNRVFPPPA